MSHQEIEMKAKVMHGKENDTLLKLCQKFGAGNEFSRIDYYLINNSSNDEVRISWGTSMNNNSAVPTYKLEQTVKIRNNNNNNNVENNIEHTILLNGSLANILEFWEVLGFTLDNKKTKIFICFEDDVFHIYYTTIAGLDHAYVEAEYHGEDAGNAEEALCDLFNALDLDEFENKRYTEII